MAPWLWKLKPTPSPPPPATSVRLARSHPIETRVKLEDFEIERRFAKHLPSSAFEWMETHLHLAHRSHRKAEHYNQSHQFTEAIFHFQKSAEYLELSLQNTTCDTIRSSLLVQRQYCLEQIEFLKKRLRNKIHKEVVRKNQNSPITVSDSNLRKPFAELVIANFASITKMAFSSKELQTKYDNFHQTINELELIILDQFLKNDEETKEETKSKVEQIKALNGKLKNLFSDLMENMDKTLQGMQALKNENQTLRKEIAASKNNPTQVNKVAFPELPPLEPPTLLY